MLRHLVKVEWRDRLHVYVAHPPWPPWPRGPPKAMKTPDAGARFDLSWSCAVAGLGVFAVSSPCLQPSGGLNALTRISTNGSGAMTWRGHSCRRLAPTLRHGPKRGSRRATDDPCRECLRGRNRYFGLARKPLPSVAARKRAVPILSRDQRERSPANCPRLILDLPWATLTRVREAGGKSVRDSFRLADMKYWRRKCILPNQSGGRLRQR
jgi:hypothetical protein